MELKYIWIEDYKNIRNQGFCFQNQDNEKWHFDGRRLTVSTNEAAIESGFFGENISSVTAIVGKNGSGKSNLMEYIMCNLMNYYAMNGGSMFYETLGNRLLIVGKYITYNAGMSIENLPELEGMGYRGYQFRSSVFAEDSEFMKAVSEGRMETARIIYYSNYTDFRPVERRDNVRDLSTDYLVGSDLYDAHKFDTDSMPRLDAHYWMEMNRTVEFLVASKRNSLPVEMPKLISLWPNFEADNPRLRQSADISNENWEVLSIWESELINNLRLRGSEVRTGYLNISGKARKTSSLALLRLNILRTYYSLNQPLIPSSTDEVHAIMYGNFDGVNQNRELFAVLELTSTLAAYIEENDVEVEDGSSSYSSIDRNRENRGMLGMQIRLEGGGLETVSEIVDVTKKLLNHSRIWDFSIHHQYSSGERSLLVLFSRLYSLTSSTWWRLESQDNNLQIHLDEGEIGMHPEWQRNYLKWVLKFFDDYFPDRKIQLILATHSPFLLSDLPSQNVIALDRDGDGYCKQVSLERSQTFSANIHSLFSHGFFMESTIGAFAEEKINWLIRRLNEEDLSENEFSHLQQYIDLIGEPILQKQLQRMLNEKREEDPRWIAAEIERLQRKLPNQGGSQT